MTFEASSTRQNQKRAETVNAGDVFEGYVVLRPLKAIRAKCLDCCGGSSVEVRACEIKACPLYPHRLGRRIRKSEVDDGR